MEGAQNYSLRQRVLKAGAWSLVGYAFSSVFRLASNLIMTRELAPDMFGLMAIASMVFVGLALFSDLGLQPSVVQSKRGDEPQFLNTAWSIQILRGLVLGCAAIIIGVVLSLAGSLDLFPSGSVYANPDLPLVIAVLSLTTIIAGFESTKSLQASRNLLIVKVTRIEIISQLTGFAVMFGWVHVQRSIWALVAGAIAVTCTKTVLSHLALPGATNRFQWDSDAVTEIVRLGKWLFLSSVLYFVVSNGDRMLLGAMVDARSLGAYAIAFLIFSSIDQVLSRIIVDVSFPALSEIARDQPAKLSEAYYKFHTAIAAATYFGAGILMAAGQGIIAVLYDTRYQQAGWILQILSVALLTQPFRVAAQSFLAFGLARTFSLLNAVRLITLFIAFPIGFAHWGFEGAVWGVVASYFSSLPLIWFYSDSLGLLDLRKELRALPALAAGLLIGGLLAHALALIPHHG